MNTRSVCLFLQAPAGCTTVAQAVSADSELSTLLAALQVKKAHMHSLPPPRHTHPRPFAGLDLRL